MTSKSVRKQGEPPRKKKPGPALTSEHFLGARPLIALGTLLSALTLSLGDLLEIIPPFAPLTASPAFILFHAIHDLMALAVAIYAAYKYHTRLGVAAIVLFLTAHIPYAIIQSPKEFPELLRILVIGFATLFGIWLIDRLRKSEERLRTTEAQASTTLNSMIEGCQTIGFDWRYLYVNDAAAKQGHRNIKELLGHTMMEIYPGIEKTEMFVNLRSCMELRFSHHMENLFSFPDGSQRWFDLSMEPVNEGVFILSLDITERKRTEQALGESEERYKSLVENASDYIFMISKDYRVLSLNRAGANGLGKKPEEIIGKTIFDIFPEWLATGYAESIKKTLETGTASVHENQLIAGESKSYISTSLSPVKDSENEVTGVIGVSRDITGQKQLEEAIHVSEGLYRSLFENMLNGFAYCKMLFEEDKPSDFVYVSINSAFETLTGLKNVMGKKVSEVIPGIQKSDPELFEIYGRVALTGMPERFESYVQALEMWFSVSVYSPGKGYFVAVFDVITERKKAEEQLRIAQQNFQNSLDNSPLGIRIITEDGELLYANKAILDICGCASLEEFRNTPAREQYTPASYAEHQKRRELRKQGKPVPSNYEISIVRKKDGEIRHLTVSRKEVTWNDKTQFQAVYQDITERKQIEGKLLESEERFRQLFEQAPVGMVLSTSSGRIISMNKALLKMHGYDSMEEFDKTPISGRYYSIGDRERWLKLMQKQGTVEGFEVQLKRKDGTSFWAFSNALQQVNESGEERILNVIQDITERKRAQEALRESEQKYRNLFNSIPDACCWAEIILDRDNKPIDYRILEANEAWGKVNSVDAQKAIGRNRREILPITDLSWIETYGKVALTREPASFERYSAVTGKWLRASVYSPRDRQFVTILSDVTERRQAEEQIRLQAELLDMESDSVDLHDFEGNILYANKAFYHTLGYTREELLNMNLNHLDDRESKDKTPARLKELTEKGTAAFNIHHRHKNGSWIPLEVHAAIIELGGRKLIISVSHDISERLKVEERLRESEKKYRTLIEGAPVGIIVTTMSGNIIDVNDALVKMHGYNSQEEFTRTPVSARYYDMRDRERWLKILQERGKVEDFEVQVKRKDGTLFWTLNNTLPRTTVSSEEQQFITVIQDITQRKQAEEMLEHSVREWESTFDSITDLISIHSADHRILRMNKAFADSLNMTKDEIRGKFCYELVHGTDRPPAYCPHNKTLLQKTPAAVEEYEPHLGMWLQISTSPIFDEKGEVVATVHATKDITEHKKMDERLMLTDRMAAIGQLASGIAHELNNPLTGVIGFSELVLEKEIADDVREDLIIINKEAKRTANIVKGLLTFARKQSTEKESVDINRIIQEVLQMRSYEQRVSNIEVKTRLATDLPQIMGSGAQLQQVFINLIVNAEQSMAEAHNRGTFTITTERVGDIVKTCFADDGTGISPENMRRLFTPFFTTKEVGKGTGLGLSICHGIITEHGGRIYAESEPGKGATFIVEIPISK